MKRFRFSLETVLKLREWKEDEEIRKLSVVVSELNALFAEREFNEKEIDRSYREIESSAKVGTSLSDYLSIERYIQGLMKLNEDLALKIEAKNEDVDLVRQGLILARKDKKVIEVLKENRYLEWKKKRKRQERREVEEYNSSLAASLAFAEGIGLTEPKAKGKIPKTFKILNREDGGDELMSDFKNLRDFYEKYYMGKGK